MEEIDFFNITQDTLNELAKEKGITDLSRYYQLTDYTENSPIANYDGMSQIFAQMAFHAQNATLISNIVCFEKNQSFLNKTLCKFNPKEFLETYSPALISRSKSVDQIIEALRYTEEKGDGLKWNSAKSKPKNKDTIMRRYAETLLDCAEYVNKFKTKQDFLEDLLKHYENKNFKDVVGYFRKQVRKGFSVALTCDFLKEFDIKFNDLPKPDIHIKDTLCEFYGYDKKYYDSSDDKVYECIKNFQDLTKKINDSLPLAKKINVYQLDRMIWLICSGNFYLDITQDPKSMYMDRIKAARTKK